MIKHALKRILPRETIDLLQGLVKGVDIRIAMVASTFNWSATLYYFLFNSEFRREMRSVLLARKRFHQSRSGRNLSSYSLRRNIHRLEKGLIMRPRRPIFAEGYIEETVKYFHKCIDLQCLSMTELDWCHSVLAEYFSVIRPSDVIDRARSCFQEINALTSPSPPNNRCIPLAYSDLRPNNVSFDSFKLLCERRHSVRWFKAKPVPKELLDAAIDVAATAPSACNRQPFTFYVFNEPTRAQEIGAIPMGTAGFSQNFQTLVVIVGDLSAYPFEKDRHIIYIDSGLAAMQLQLALETQGLGSCTINWPDIERCERQMALELGLEPFERPVMLIAVGYPLAEGLVPYSAKKTASDIVVRPK
ncbi:MAG: nitroreductase family protein [Porticoccaceae bacterium]|nr:nitroreductase family protein [Porticoccaceae bacterium]